MPNAESASANRATRSLEVRAVAKQPSLFRRLLRSRSAVIGGILILAISLVAVFASMIAPYDPIKQSFKDQLQPPS